MKEPKVGNKLNGWTIARIWEWPNWYDLQLFGPKREIGNTRIFKSR